MRFYHKVILNSLHQVALLSMLVSIPSLSVAAGYSHQYFPLLSGNSWTYNFTGPDGSGNKVTRVQPGTVDINGVATKELLDSDGDRDYLTSDAINGIRFHRESDSDPVYGGTSTYSPPIQYALPMFSVGDTANSSGSLTMSFTSMSCDVPCALNYSSSATVQAVEVLNTAAFGNLDTTRIYSAENITGTLTVGGIPVAVNENITMEIWVARYLGVVKQTFTDSTGTETISITSTTVAPATDLNTDGSINSLDIGVLMSLWDSNTVVADGDNVVNSSDLALLRTLF